MSAAVHPRRRPARSSSPDMTFSLLDSFRNMSIRKGDTFHQPSTYTTTDLWDPLEAKPSSPSMPGRSTTCPRSLEDLLLGAGDRRAAELIARVDKAIETNSKLALSHVLNEPEVLPIPTFMLGETSAQTELAPIKGRPRTHRNSHSSDSGLGSSVADSVESPAQHKKTAVSLPTSPTSRPLDGISHAVEDRGLSNYAALQIHKHIVEPILREETLKEFHPLIKDVPARIGNKDIKNLRELEKTLIFLAPEYSRSPSKYLRFCERTVRVLHTTVTTLHESDQRAPADRPYTQGYFFDLVEQIRRYATILAATREKQAKGENMDAMDYTSDESISLFGGMTHNGKPAELVRHKDGKAISLATGEVLSSEELASSSTKRPMTDVDAEHDDVLRSMARRKKNAKPEIHGCPLCDKEFKRPCDLTKHVKTHERPFKCPDEDCKYHEHGWPTEKERDRHVNDKHSNAPALYHCLFKPCPYTSKRESNCKQHMEKAHGWEYVRSKSNGKGKLESVIRLPRGSIPPSPASAMLTPLTPIAPSPSTQSWSTSSHRESMPPPVGVAGPSNYSSNLGTPAWTHPSPDFASHFNMNFNFNDMSMPLPTPEMSDRRDSCDSSRSGLQLDGSAFDDAISPDHVSFENFSFDSFAFQNPSPASNVSAGPSGIAGGFQYDSKTASTSTSSSRPSFTSPGAQLDQTFTTAPHGYDAMTIDEGFGDFSAAPDADFTLFGAANGVSASPGGEMFPALAANSWDNLGSQFNMETTPAFTTGTSTLEDLFPELKGH